MTKRHFTPELFAFLRDLADHNEREWFNANKARYESAVRQPALDFITDFVEPLETISPYFVADSRTVGGSLFRIHRDTRFSKDKTPYKTQVDLWFWEGDNRGRENAGYFFRLTPQGLLLGAGMHGLQKVPLQKYRDAVDVGGAALQGILDDIQGAGFGVMGESGKRVPRGYDKEHPTPSS